MAVLLVAAPPIAGQSIETDDETCLDCHEDFEAPLALTPHRLSSPLKSPRITVHCTSCHREVEEHLDDPSEETIVSPSRLTPRAILEVCTRCHGGHFDADGFGLEAHPIEQLGCTDCHRIHGSSPRLLVDDKAEFCLRCHDPSRTAFGKRSNHPLMQGAVTCLSCHRNVKRQDSGLAYDLFSPCRDCHPEQGGPFLFEHEAVNAYTVDGSGCTECHDPHGSANDRLLRQPAERLCEHCHSPPRHRTAHGGIWAQRPCQECHVDIHGSFVSRYYLDPNLPDRLGGNCFDAGCHGLDG